MKNSRGKNIIFLLFVLFLVSIQASESHAHKVYLFAWVEGDTIYTESYFSKSKKVNDGIIKVYDPSGKELLTGKTNEKGEFSFEIPQRTDLRIVLKSSMGHGAEYLFKRDEFPEGEDSLTGGKEKEGGTEPVAKEPEINANRDEIRKMIEDTLDARLKPISRSIARLSEEKGPGITEVIGGIGYIFGIMGIILYFKSKGKRG